jgi:hypothetical protein
MVTKLAPARIVGLMMGVWFLSISLGNKLGGYTAGFFERLPLPTLFGAVAATTVAAGTDPGRLHQPDPPPHGRRALKVRSGQTRQDSDRF